MDIRTHKKPESIWLFDYNSLAAMSNCAERMIWLSERDWNIICQAVLNIDRFRSRVFTEANGQNYVIATPDEFSEFQEWVSDMNVHLGGFPLCNDILTQQNEILQAMAEALQALVDKPCCPSTGTGTGSRGTGGTAAPPNPFDDDGEPGSFPPTFEDRDEWKSHQCNQAEDILNALKADLLGLSGLSYSASTPTGMVGLLIGILLTPIPFDDLIALLGFLIYTGYNYALLATMATQIEGSQDELRCILYSASSVETAQSDLLAELTEIADAAFALEADKVWVMETIGFMVPTDSLNRLFTDQPTIAQDADCSDCEESGISPWTVVYGNATNTSPDNPIGGEGVYEPGYGCLLNARHFGVSFAQPASVNLFTVDGVVPPVCSGGPTFFYYSDDNFTTLISSTNSAPQFDPAVGIRSMYVVWDGSGIGDNVILQQEPYV